MEKLLITLSCVLLLACGGGGGGSTASTPNTTPTVQPAGPQLQANGFVVPMWSYTNHNDALASLTALKNTAKANSIVIDFHLVTSSLSGNDVSIQNPSLVSGLLDVMQIAKSLGFDIWFKPIVIIGANGTNWQYLSPSNPQLWFSNYSKILNQLADSISPYGVTHYLITNELYSLTTDANNSGYWSALINSLKNHYSGRIGFNSGGLLGNCNPCNEFLNIPSATLQSLSFIGISAYPRLISPQALTISNVTAAWKNDFYNRNLESLVNGYIAAHPGLRVFFTELGSPAYFGGNVAPASTADVQSQSNFYQASLADISTNMPNIGGVFVYNWTLNSQSWVTTNGGINSPFAWDMYNKPSSYSVFSNQWSGGSGGTSTSRPNAIAEGAWTGTTSDGYTVNLLALENGSTYDIFGTVSGNVFSVLGFDEGTLGVSGSTISGPLREYVFNGSTSTGSVSGAAITGASITGSKVFATTTTTFSLSPLASSTYSYTATPHLIDVAGSWTGKMLDGTSATISIDATTGAITGTNSGCSFSGTSAYRSSGKNVFDVSLTFGGAPCGLPGTTVTGVAIDYAITGTALKQLIVALQDPTKAHGALFIASR